MSNKQCDHKVLRQLNELDVDEVLKEYENLENCLICDDCSTILNVEGEVVSKYPGCKCWQCPFNNAPFVPPDGPEDSEILFVAMQPAYYEVREGKPMSGPSGACLNGALEEFSIKRKDVRVDNASLCQGMKAGEGDPPIEVIDACRQHVLDNIKRARAVVCLGNAAVKSALGNTTISRESITSLTGRAIEIDGKWYLFQIHPAFYLRQPSGSDMFRDFLDTISLLKRLKSGGWSHIIGEVTTKIFYDKVECIEFLNNLNEDSLVVDLETDYPDPVKGVITCVSLAYNNHEAFIIPWDSSYLVSWNYNEENGLLEDQEVYDALKSCLERHSGVIAHNAPFDIRLLRREDINVKIKDDTLLMHYALDERATAQSLKRIARFCLGVKDWETELSNWLKRKDDPYTEIPPYVLFDYAGKDACYTHALWELFQKDLKSAGNEGPHRLYANILKPINNMLIEIGLEGVNCDGKLLADAIQKMPSQMWELEKEMSEIVGDKLYNPNSPRQVKAALNKLGIPVQSTRKEVLEQYEDASEFVAMHLEYKRMNKVHGTYMMNFARGYINGKIYPDLRLFGTVNGRMSGGKINPLVFPRESRGDLYKQVKDVICGDSEYAVWVSDFKSAEYRTLAFLANDEWLMSQFMDPNVDFHTLMAEQMYQDFFYNADDAGRKEMRVVSKMLNFGLNYGRGPRSVAEQLGYTIAKAQKLIDDYFAPMPNVLKIRQKWQYDAIEQGYLENPFGRRRRFNLITRQNQPDIERQALNFPPASTSNDMNMLTMYRIWKEMNPIVKPKFPIHDSIVAFIRRDSTADQIQQLIEIIRETPKQVLNTDLEFFFDIHVGNTWGSARECATIEEILEALRCTSD
jgi:uracil-DNA glycosylase family 4